MPIEFHCTLCQHRLRTPDGSAGKKSRCPQCGHIQPIPSQSESGFEVDRAPAGGQAAGPAQTPSSVSDTAGDPPWAAPESALAPQPGRNPFADVPVAPQNPYSAPQSQVAARRNPRATVFPGVMLIVFAAPTILLLLFVIGIGVVSVQEQGLKDDDVMAFIVLGVTVISHLVMLWGGVNMVRRRGYAMAMVGAVTAMVPLSLCWCFHLPLGIWALLTLMGEETRAVFSADRNA